MDRTSPEQPPVHSSRHFLLPRVTVVDRFECTTKSNQLLPNQLQMWRSKRGLKIILTNWWSLVQVQLASSLWFLVIMNNGSQIASEGRCGSTVLNGTLYLYAQTDSGCQLELYCISLFLSMFLAWHSGPVPLETLTH